MRRHLVLFVRAPELGRGKRRLAAAIGDVAAVRFERLMLARLRRELGHDRRWRLRLAVTPDRKRPRGATGQGSGDLGVRMHRALAACPPGPAVLVGADIPRLTANHIAEAFRLLGRHDVVFGPAEDGGFWLIGARHRPPLFRHVRWSTPHALADARTGLPRRVSVGLAARLADVDDAERYFSWRRGISSTKLQGRNRLSS
ncbi:MAG TPA: TIGR04282 family arsenosugar biosynthesis glycosyltransferase [Stellaceae bacterium]|nr:TIGR04282 family arsenosugar biosynthesis glycosyltransferase [Stellaceae bacterium]